MRKTLVSILLLSLVLPLSAQKGGVNYDESKVPSYSLPDLLVTENGKPVRTARRWEKIRRPEILHLFETQVYGVSPAAPAAGRSQR